MSLKRLRKTVDGSAGSASIMSGRQSLNQIRLRIDSIDSQVLKLLNQRAKVILDIVKVKGKVKESIYAPHREKDVYRKLLAQNTGPLSREAVEAIYREVMSSALQLERPLRIAYMGPEFTFSHMASMKRFGSSVTYAPCVTITDVFSEVAKGRADYGVVPIENSIEGAINHTLDMFVDSDLKICSEVYLEICHNLLSNQTDKNKIKRIYSNPQVFGQCRLWLESNLPKAELIEVSSTTRAAQIAAKEKDSACIASEPAAGRYGLKILYKSIEDSTHNVTRFLVVGETNAKPTREDKTSIMFSVKDKAGALHDMLLPFKKYKINMTKIESRPSKVKAWEYYFFVDLEGHYADKRVRAALEELEKNSAFMKVLGSYPAEIGRE